MANLSMLKSLKPISINLISRKKITSRCYSVHKFVRYHRAANHHSQGCSSCLPARASLHARVCLGSPLRTTRARKKRVSARPVKIFRAADVARLFADFWRIRRTTGVERESRVQTLFRDVPQEYEVFRTSGRGRGADAAPGNEYCNFVGDGNCFLSASVEDLADQRNVNLFLSNVRHGASRTMLRIDLRNYGDAWNVTQPCGYVRYRLERASIYAYVCMHIHI